MDNHWNADAHVDTGLRPSELDANPRGNFRTENSLSYSDSLVTPPSASWRSLGTPPNQNLGSFEDTDLSPSITQKRNKFLEHFFGLPGVLGGVVSGVLLGIILQICQFPSNVGVWVGMPGDLFIRAVTCIVYPLIFCALVVSMADMSIASRATDMGWRTLACYLFTAFVASAEGTAWAAMFKEVNAFSSTESPSANETAAPVAIECGDSPGMYLTYTGSGSGSMGVSCQYSGDFDSSRASGNYSMFNDTTSLFLLRDLNTTYERTDGGNTDQTISEALQGELEALVPENMTAAFADGTLLSIIALAMLFGAMIARGNARGKLKAITNVFRDLHDIFMDLVGWVIMFTPIAICSLLAQTIGKGDELREEFMNVVVYCACDICALLVHVGVFYPAFLLVFVNTNPYKWMAKMTRAQLVAMGCASSAATLPVAMECVHATGKVPKDIYRFILSLGSTVGMDGTAVGTPIATIFMAHVTSVDLKAWHYFLIWFVSALGALSVGPVPNADIVLILTVWHTIFPGESDPPALAYILATDWFLDRLQTPVNVTNDTIVCRIIAEKLKKFGPWPVSKDTPGDLV